MSICMSSLITCLDFNKICFNHRDDCFATTAYSFMRTTALLIFVISKTSKITIYHKVETKYYNVPCIINVKVDFPNGMRVYPLMSLSVTFIIIDHTPMRGRTCSASNVEIVSCNLIFQLNAFKRIGDSVIQGQIPWSISKTKRNLAIFLDKLPTHCFVLMHCRLLECPPWVKLILKCQLKNKCVIYMISDLKVEHKIEFRKMFNSFFVISSHKHS